jgi:TetR/AcrR family transcriptional regulator, fatty acid metabolism regulator protein
MARPKAADKSRRILDAATRVFARKGYFAARVSDVAKKAGVADGTIYLYFRNKEDILVRLFDEVMSEHVSQAREAVRALPSAPERLRTIAERHLAVLGGNRDLAVVFQVELRQSTHFMERFTGSWLRDYFDLLHEVIDAGQRDGTLRADFDRRLAAKALFGALDEMVTSWLLSDRRYSLQDLAAPVVDLFLRGAAVPVAAALARPVPAAAASGRRGQVTS